MWEWAGRSLPPSPSLFLSFSLRFVSPSHYIHLSFCSLFSAFCFLLSAPPLSAFSPLLQFVFITPIHTGFFVFCFLFLLPLSPLAIQLHAFTRHDDCLYFPPITLGKDATTAFDDVGHSTDARAILEGLKIGSLKKLVILRGN